MAKLYTLLFGKSKKRMRPIMVDTYDKCEKYKNKRESTKNLTGWHEIIEASEDSDTWRQKSCTIGGNRCESVGRVGHGPAGYISSRGFVAHT